MDGTVNWIYQAGDLKCPQGVVTGLDILYICSKDDYSIHVVSPGGGKLAVIPTKQYNIKWPQAIYYCREEETFYVSSASTEPKHKNFVRRLTFK